MIDLTTLAIVAVLSVVFYLFLNRNSAYWKVRNVAYIPPAPLVGNAKSLLLIDKSVGDYLSDIYNAPEAKGQPFVGIHLWNGRPALVLRDPEIIRNVLIKDFEYFSNRAVYSDDINDPVGYHNLFSIRGSKWKFLRTKLTPTFTSGKMKHMFHLIREVGEELADFLNDSIKGKDSVILETKGTMLRFAVDTISTCAFGIKSNCLSNPKSEFRHIADGIFSPTLRRAIEWRALFFLQEFTKFFKCYLLGTEATQFFRSVFNEAMEERIKRQIQRNDFLDILLGLRKEQEEKIKNNTADEMDRMYEFKGDFLMAQSSLFFTAGFESSSTTISMTLYELALHQDIQAKVRAEIMNKIEAHEGKLTYEGIFEMTYLTQVVAETLRKYPPLPFLDRVCTKNYKIPGTDVVIEKDTPVYIAMYRGLHYDPVHYEDPEKFDPERFTDDKKKNRHQYAYIPFGEGPRSCIGTRFGYLAVYTALCHILPKFKVEVCDKTQIPLVIDNRAIMTTLKGGNYLKFIKI